MKFKLTEKEIKNIRNSPNSQNWMFISCFQDVPEDFIREFKDYVYWNYICWQQILSEDFIIEFKDKVDWAWVSLCQKLSNKFIRKNISKLNKEYLLKNENISEEIKQTIKLFL